MADLNFLMVRGLFREIQEFPGEIAGICGGFQMLGKRVLDPHNVESHIRVAEGLGLLDAETSMRPEKETHQAEAVLQAAGERLAPGCAVALEGYEIHMGETVVGPGSSPFAVIVRRSGREVEVPDGAVSPDGRVFGTYLHGIFDNDTFRRAFLNRIRAGKGLEPLPVASPREEPYDLLAAHLEKHLDMARLFRICGITS
jgi:adenosylcobyric acid synthase